jgi:hypothetical protein
MYGAILVSKTGKHFRCSRKWEIVSAPVAMHKNARKSLHNWEIEPIRCYRTFPPVRPTLSNAHQMRVELARPFSSVASGP